MLTWTRPALAAVVLLHLIAAGTVHGRASQEDSSKRALPDTATGEDIFVAACATCHGIDGKGPPADIRSRIAAAQRPSAARLHRLCDEYR